MEDRKRDKLVIAIDGPAGAGKSTIARMVAQRLGYRYIDTGAMYRALTLKALRTGTDCEDEEALVRLLRESSIKFARGDREDGGAVVLLDGENVSQEIRLPVVTRKVSLVARAPGVRRELVRRQRELAAVGGVVMDGRDIGTIVLPDADIKIFLTASLEERANRRYRELQQKGLTPSLAAIKAEVAERDRLDQERELGPLVQAPDAFCIDTTDLTPEEVTARILKLCADRGRI